MLVLERKTLESLMIGGLNGRGPPIVVTVVKVTNGYVTLGITASRNIPIDRSEIHELKLFRLDPRSESHPENTTGANSHVAP